MMLNSFVKLLLLILLLVFINTSNGQNAAPVGMDYKGFCFTSVSPTMILDQWVPDDTAQTFVYNAGNYVIYKLPYMHIDTGISKLFRYLTTRADSSFGYLGTGSSLISDLSGSRCEIIKTVNSCSELFRIPLGNILHEFKLDVQKFRSFSSGDTITEEYVMFARSDSFKAGSIKLVYSPDMNEFNYSLSREMDSIINATNKDLKRKLVLIDISFNEYQDPATKQVSPAFKLHFSVEKTDVIKPEEVKLAIEMYEKSVQSQ